MTDSPATAKIAVAAATYWVDRPFDYRIPPALADKVVPGVRVVVPFGGGNRRTEGIVLSLGTAQSGMRLKSIASVLDASPVLSPEMIRLAVWLRERYFCTVYDAVHAMLPAGLWYQMESVYTLCAGFDRESAYAAAGKSAQEQLVLDAVFAHGGSCPLVDLERLFENVSPARALQSLVRKGVLETDSREKRRVGDKKIRMVSLTVSAEDAQVAADRREKRAPLQSACLRLLCTLDRVSFSELCYFTGASSSSVNALVKAGLAEITQDEVFRRSVLRSEEQSPLPVLNEEQRAAFEGILSLYDGEHASASLLYGVTGSGKTSVYVHLIDAMRRKGKASILLVPEIALTPQMIRIFSSYFGDDVAVLHSSLAVGERYDEWKRIKTGRARVVIGTRSAVFAPCSDLGLIIMDEEQEYTYKSENSPRYHARDAAKFRCASSNALLILGSATPDVESRYRAEKGVYHLFTLKNRFNARQLPSVRALDDACPECGGLLNQFGTGTQKLEEHLREALPDVEILRMDADSVSPAGSHEKILSQFREKKVPILIGTQMVTKGLDFENVTLVGVISADQLLYCGDYRAGERCFSLITQVVGRSGRGAKPGRAIIQTFTPQNPVIGMASRQDYEGFYAEEIELRRLQNCPPFSDIVTVTVSAEDESAVLRCCTYIRDRIRSELRGRKDAAVLGPAPLPVVRVSNRYRYHVTLHCRFDKEIRTLVSGLLIQCNTAKEYKGVSVFADYNPME